MISSDLHKVYVIFIAITLCYGSAHSQTQVDSTPSTIGPSFVGPWHGIYVCNNIKGDFDLVISSVSEGQVEATATYRQGNVVYKVAGSLGANNVYKLSPVASIKNTVNAPMMALNGTVSKDQKTLYGRIPECGEKDGFFKIERSASNGNDLASSEKTPVAAGRSHTSGITEVIVEGVVGVGSADYRGVFLDKATLASHPGYNLIGKPFVAVFFIDPTKGKKTVESTRNGSTYGELLFGDSGNGSPSGFPVSAELTIAGKTVQIALDNPIVAYRSKAHIYYVEGGASYVDYMALNAGNSVFVSVHGTNSAPVTTAPDVMAAYAYTANPLISPSGFEMHTPEGMIAARGDLQVRSIKAVKY